MAMSLLLAACAGGPSRPTGQFAVAAPDAFGADAAIDILSAGGNAVDAAVATAFALAVTYPEAGNIGGGGFLLIRHGGEHVLIDGREVAPRKAARDMYLDGKGDVVPGRSTVGVLAAGVPGEVMALWTAHEKFGKLPWKRLLASAVRLAEEGFIVPPRLARGIRSHTASLKGRTNFAEHFGSAEAGQVFKQPDLARTLRLISEGPDGFYRGATARLTAQFMKERGGLIDEEDLARYQARIRRPIHAKIPDLGIEVVTTPPPSSGGIALIQLLKMSAARRQQLRDAKFGTAQYVHLVAEMEKRVFADRAEYLGDPDFFRVPVDTLVSDAYCRGRADLVDPAAISKTADVKPGRVESPQTTHFSVVDAEGNAVAHTTTLNGAFGCGEVVPGAGFLLNNEMDDFSAKPGAPNMFGVVGGDANAVHPGKRMLSSMCPTMVYGTSRRLITGTPGGPTIFTSVYQVVMNIYFFDMPLKDAMDRPRFHHQLLPPDRIDVESRRSLGEAVLQELRARGYAIAPRGSLGDVHSILIGPERVEAYSDPRGSGKARVGLE